MTDDVLSFVLNGLEDYLELERELGKRTIIESSDNRIIELLGDLRESAAAVDATRETGASRETRGSQSAPIREIRGSALPQVPHAPRVAPVAPTAGQASSASSGNSTIRPFDHSIISPFAFIHDRPLSPKAVEMMSKIIVALGQTLETAPIAVEPPLPKARFYVFLGRRALLKYLPGARAEENHWFKTPKGLDALYVKSPEDIVRYTTVTPALQKMKQDMWRALKTVSQRLTMA